MSREPDAVLSDSGEGWSTIRKWLVAHCSLFAIKAVLKKLGALAVFAAVASKLYQLKQYLTPYSSLHPGTAAWRKVCVSLSPSLSPFCFCQAGVPSLPLTRVTLLSFGTTLSSTPTSSNLVSSRPQHW